MIAVIAVVVPVVAFGRSTDQGETLASSIDAPTVVGDLADLATFPPVDGATAPEAPAATTAENEVTRAALEVYLDHLQEVVDSQQFAVPGTPQLALPAVDLSGAVDAARSLVAELDGAELTAMQTVIDVNPGWAEQPSRLEDAVESNPFDLSVAADDVGTEVLSEFRAPTGLVRAAADTSGPAAVAAHAASTAMTPAFIGPSPSAVNDPAGILSNCQTDQPDLKGLFYSYWVAAQIAGAAGAVASGIPDALTYIALTIVTGVIFGVANGIAIALDHALTLAQDCVSAKDNDTFRASLPTDPSAITTANPTGFTPGSTQTSVDELGSLIGGVADDLDDIDAEVVEILADQLVVLEALGVAQLSASQVQMVAADLQVRAKDLLANVGTAADGAIEDNSDVECVAATAPAGFLPPVQGAQPCNTANGLANTIDARLDTILTDTADFQALSLRASIERALADPSQPAIGLFALPVDQGGYLETVRDIVTDTITNHTDAGQGVGNAQAALASANESFAAGQFSFAYAEYARAYRAAVR